MKFEEKLQKLRKASGFSQEVLADKLGVSRQAVSKWESGSSYPEMDKLIQMTNIFDCSLDELVNDSDTDKTIIKNNVSKKMYLDSFMEFVTKSVNMFSSMKFGNLIKSIIELGVMGLIILAVCYTIYVSGDIFLNEIVFSFHTGNEIMWGILNFIGNILSAALLFIVIVVGLIIYLQIYKIRYLDYYDKLIYEYDQKKRNEVFIEEEKVEEKIEKKETVVIEEKRNDRIVIRDPEHRPFAFLSPVATFIKHLFKIFLGLVGALFIGSLVFFIVWTVISIYLTSINNIFIGVIIALVGLIVFNVLVIELIYKAITEIKVNFKRILIQSLICIFISSIGAGVFIVSLKDIDFVEYGDDKYFVEEVVELDTNVNTISLHNYYDTALIIDDSIEQGLVFKINYNKDLSSYDIKNINNEIVLVTDSKVDTIKEAVNYYIDKLDNNEILMFDLYDRVYVEIKGNKETIEGIVKYLRDQKGIIYTDENHDGVYHAW